MKCQLEIMYSPSKLNFFELSLLALSEGFTISDTDVIRLCDAIYRKNQIAEINGMGKLQGLNKHELENCIGSDYGQLIEFLVQCSVLNSFYNQRTDGRWERQYTFTREYWEADIEAHPLSIKTNSSIVNPGNKENNDENLITEQLNKWLNPRLSLPVPSILWEINNAYSHPFLSDDELLRKALDKIAVIDFHFHRSGHYRDEHAFQRIHSLFSLTSPEIKKHIKYGGRDLVEVTLEHGILSDLVFFFDQNRWEIEHPDNREFSLLWKGLGLSQSGLTEAFKAFQNRLLRERPTSSFIRSRNQFINDMINGKVYERIGAGMAIKKKKYRVATAEERIRMVKRELQKELNHPDSQKRVENPNNIMSVLAKEYPIVLELSEFIKRVNNKDLFLLTERLKSCILIDKVCGRLIREFPEIPLFPTYDGIITINEDYRGRWMHEIVQRVMYEEFEKAIGIPPVTGVNFFHDEEEGRQNKMITSSHEMARAAA